MSLSGLGEIFDFGSKLLDKFIPDPVAKMQAQTQLLQMQQTGELAQLSADTDLAKGQMGVNQVEAGSASLFVSGWRPFIGWVCGLACAWNWVFLPLAVALAKIFHNPIELAPADLHEMTPILIGMLGLGGMRMVEKLNGVAAK